MKTFKTLFSARITLLMLIPALVGFVNSDKPSYQIFTGAGSQTTYSRMLLDLAKADVVFFGELHNNAISHWMEFELASDLYLLDTTALIMGAEMFESDNQMILDEYLKGQIRERDFEAAADLWDNYKTDYKPLITLAATKGIPFVATNIPRRYAAIVNGKGFEGLEGLSAEAKALMAPLPVPYDPELKNYKAMLQMGAPGMHANQNLPKAQAIKDATMAWFIAGALKPGKRFFHFNGSYHSDDHEGIIWYLNQYAPKLKILTIATVEQEQLDSLGTESLQKADYILAVHQNVTKTY